MVLSRGILAALLLIVMAAFALINLVLAPVIEGTMIPTKELRADFTGSGSPDLTFPPIIPIDVLVTVRERLLHMMCSKRSGCLSSDCRLR